ncbi:MAG: methyltransferase [Tahibacter sp.]
MIRLALPLIFALVLSACGSTPPPAAPVAAAPGSTVAPPPAKPEADQPDTPPPPQGADQVVGATLDQVLAGAWRSDKNKARDVYRHPKQTLEFFGIKPAMTVIEITPGGGWYTEVLAPLLHGHGKLVAALVEPSSAEKEGTRKYLDKSNGEYRTKLAADTTNYAGVEVREFALTAPNFGAPSSADMVLTFRNVHNFLMWNSDAAVFKAFFGVLKPGGVLGVTDHRAAAGADLAKIRESGYIPEEYVIKLATDAGFVLDGRSEINANAKDTKDYPGGVWTLPPTLGDGDKDKDKYLAIGESDRMTLRFKKPAGATTAASDQVFSADDKVKAVDTAKH